MQTWIWSKYRPMPIRRFAKSWTLANTSLSKTKKLQAAKKKQKQIQIKEIKFRPGTEEGDYQVKLRSLIKFLNEGDKTKITVRFKGRELTHRELGMDLLKRIETDLEEMAIVEQFPKLEGRQMVMVMGPKKKK